MKRRGVDRLVQKCGEVKWNKARDGNGEEFPLRLRAMYEHAGKIANNSGVG